MPNKLIDETSPYLLQHANNPVDWYPWGPEALTKAQKEDKPLFLSIGYSACHWCHVMEHESFENPKIAHLLNENFVSIKVDREERPDLDQIYMNAVQLLSGRGGWPMSMFLTPDLRPFYGGTYWPPQSSRGMPGFDQVLIGVVEVWKNRRDQAVQQAEELTQMLQKIAPVDGSGRDLGPDIVEEAQVVLERSFDVAYGGFGGAPKFPQPMALQLLMRTGRCRPGEPVLEMVERTLDKMSQGGIYDHLAGGFARYSIDARWLVPHFEKMLYDNALLAGTYLDGYLVTGNQEYARVADETLRYVLRDMTNSQGGFHSTEDADSEGEEGKFYVWTPAEIRQVLNDEAADRFCYVYDVSEAGNFEGKNILNLPKTIGQCAKLKSWDLEKLQNQLAESRAALLANRNRRVRPAKDDKILVSWNALMIDSMARGAGILGEKNYLEVATGAAEFIFNHMQREDGRLLHSWCQGKAHFDAYLDDYSYLIQALITLYENNFEERWIDEAVRLAELVINYFHDPQEGGFFYTASDHERLIARNKDLYDNAVPSGNAMAAMGLWRLGKLIGRDKYLTAAEGTLRTAIGIMEQKPLVAAQMLIALDLYLSPMPELIILGSSLEPETAGVLQKLRQSLLPHRVVSCRDSGEDTPYRSSHLTPLFSGKVQQKNLPTVFVCEKFSCKAPTVGGKAFAQTWSDLRLGQ